MATKKPPVKDGVLTRAKAKQATLDELYSRLAPEAGGHRPLTDDEYRIQQDNALDAAETQALRDDLYGHWRAVAPIEIQPGVLAFAPGHAVPTTHVERYGWDAMGLVEAVDASAEGSPVVSDG